MTNNQGRKNLKQIEINPGQNRKNSSDIVNTMRIYGNGRQPRQLTTQPAFKYVDTFGSNINIMSTGTVLPGLVQVAQGTGVSARVGNRVYAEKLFLNFNIVQANTDITSQVRIMIWQWHPNSSFFTPTVLDFLETVNDVQSMYNWEFSDQADPIFDQIYFLAGTATNPTTSSHAGFYGEIPLNRARKTLEFTGASALGANQFYLLVISDSLVAPFPVLDYTTRFVYRD